MELKDRYYQRTDLTQISTYEELKTSLGMEINQAQLSFVRIGYLLRMAADSNILHDSGYRNMEEFAFAEFGLKKDAVSRFININKRFSEGGYSDRLSVEFEDFGVAKLQEMLTLPDTIVDVITPEHTKEQIREIKAELKEEQNITEIELMQEEPVPEPSVMDTLCKRFLYHFFKSEEGAESYVRIYRAVDGVTDDKKIFDTLAPSGIATIFARVPQVGKLMCTITGMDKNISVINMRNNERENLSWQEFVENLWELMPVGYKPEECWEMIYAEDFPRGQKVVDNVEDNKNAEKPVNKTRDTDFEVGEKEPENSINTLQEKEKTKLEEKKKLETVKIPEPKTPEKPVNNTRESDSEEQKKLAKAEGYLKYIKVYLDEHRWQQALYAIKDLTEEVTRLRDMNQTIDVPGQMSIEDMEDTDETEYEE